MKTIARRTVFLALSLASSNALAQELAPAAIAAAPAAAAPARPVAAAGPSAPPPPTPAQRYARGSVSLALSFGGDNDTLNDPSGSGSVSHNLQGYLAFTVRLLWRGWVLAPSANVSGQQASGFSYGSTGAPNYGGVYNFQMGGGLGVGHAFVLGPNLAFTPILRYNVQRRASLVYNPGTTQSADDLQHSIALVLPMSIYLTPHFYLEPSVSIEGIIHNSTDLSMGVGISNSLGYTF